MEFRSGRSNLKGRNKWTLEYTMTFFHFFGVRWLQRLGKRPDFWAPFACLGTERDLRHLMLPFSSTSPVLAFPAATGERAKEKS